eukprot:TRINITY_DN4046_c0_g1_i4.p1 TRINITY_DN4046_c0_g1~~TRINITY_DN4046_c0_g1_i4.p1  ORF type:complete len:428 (-),score=104.04 TRINITY_DN4046_c0_g1_i4:178-1461(-)
MVCGISLRVLIRDPTGCNEALTEKFLNRLWDVSGMKKESFYNFGMAARTELAKCAVNVIFKGNLGQSCIANGFHRRLQEIVSQELKDLPTEIAFPILRILFLISRPIDEVKINRVLADEGLIQSLFSLMKSWWERPGFPSRASEKIALREALQVLFGLTVDMGTLARDEVMSYEKYLPNYIEDVGFLISILNLPLPSPRDDLPLYEVKLSVINCFINIPLQFFRILVIIGDHALTLSNFFDVLEYELKNTDDPKKSVVTLLMVLRNLLYQAPEIRPIAFKRLFPSRDLEKEAQARSEGDGKVNIDVPDKDADTIGNRIIKLMTSFNTALQYASNDCLYSLVGENADEFVQLTGFGNAAGLLAMRGLFGMSQHLKTDTLSQVKKKMPDLIPEREGEDEEEKEDRLVRNFEKLVDAGVIQVVRKEEEKK